MVDNVTFISQLKVSGNLESWLNEQPKDSFPSYDSENGQKSYQERYRDLKDKLLPLHAIIEKGAMVDAVNEWRGDLLSEIERLNHDCPGASVKIAELQSLVDLDPLIYLNQHGKGHVDKVIEKAYEMLINFASDSLSAFEVFLLLCAIQVHDTGNVFGRKGHEQCIKKATIKLLQPIIPDVIIQNCIYRIAQAHSGEIHGNKDTLSSEALFQERRLFNMRVRERLLAAILRFADELADDSSRADTMGLSLETIPKPCIIYHQYSAALHTVCIDRNSINKSLNLLLEYNIDFNLVTKHFIKIGKAEQLLIDEIFQRTKKVELERRYCMRFLNQYLPIDEVCVTIEIDPEFDLMNPEIIKYTLKENGYPAKEITIDCPENSGEKIITRLKQKGWGL